MSFAIKRGKNNPTGSLYKYERSDFHSIWDNSKVPIWFFNTLKQLPHITIHILRDATFSSQGSDQPNGANDHRCPADSPRGI